MKVSAPYKELLATSVDFQELAYAHKDGANFSNVISMVNDETINGRSKANISGVHISKRDDGAMKHSDGDRLIKREDEILVILA